MKRKSYVLFGIVLFAAIGLMRMRGKGTKAEINPVPGSCTIFSAAVGDKVLFGNNEDYYKSQTFLWTEPATEGNYGCIYLGFKSYLHQGGINEKGLCFDANALPRSKINLHAELGLPPNYEKPYEEIVLWIPVLILRKAATVEEAIEIARKYQRKNWYPISGNLEYQLNFADAKGDAVVISVDENGELAFTRKAENENFLISTNYNRANPENALEYPCERYKITEEKLQGIKTEAGLSVDLFKSILEAVHEKGIFSRTLYSNIFDLKKGLIYLYYKHQYNEVVVLNVKDELAKAHYNVQMRDLFSSETTGKASREYILSIFLLCTSIIGGTAFMIVGLRYLKKRRLKTAMAKHSAKQ
ncbi:hypothetical protein LAG90_00345 [Marinilongibacter aquaticus]|uniref:hypothetical protein n=1 Tax=Marinilongibacter aquaticus TaxID=2975157 RepID=UPI0021BDD70E|nr:hypothetical protein [Marinilongibacter aquaticus]UBM59109.1 hypothetical protein LAG90_00345 [Marinilongibacter aquaticus]